MFDLTQASSYTIQTSTPSPDWEEMLYDEHAQCYLKLERFGEGLKLSRWQIQPDSLANEGQWQPVALPTNPVTLWEVDEPPRSCEYFFSDGVLYRHSQSRVNLPEKQFKKLKLTEQNPEQPSMISVPGQGKLMVATVDKPFAFNNHIEKLEVSGWQRAQLGTLSEAVRNALQLTLPLPIEITLPELPQHTSWLIQRNVTPEFKEPITLPTVPKELHWQLDNFSVLYLNFKNQTTSLEEYLQWLRFLLTNTQVTEAQKRSPIFPHVMKIRHQIHDVHSHIQNKPYDVQNDDLSLYLLKRFQQEYNRLAKEPILTVTLDHLPAHVTSNTREEAIISHALCVYEIILDENNPQTSDLLHCFSRLRPWFAPNPNPDTAYTYVAHWIVAETGSVEAAQKFCNLRIARCLGIRSEAEATQMISQLKTAAPESEQGKALLNNYPAFSAIMQENYALVLADLIETTGVVADEIIVTISAFQKAFALKILQIPELFSKLMGFQLARILASYPEHTDTLLKNAGLLSGAQLFGLAMLNTSFVEVVASNPLKLKDEDLCRLAQSKKAIAKSISALLPSMQSSQEPSEGYTFSSSDPIILFKELHDKIIWVFKYVVRSHGFPWLQATFSETAKFIPQIQALLDNLEKCPSDPLRLKICLARSYDSVKHLEDSPFIRKIAYCAQLISKAEQAELPEKPRINNNYPSFKLTN